MNVTDLGIVDAHVHQWDPFTTPRPFSRLANHYREVSRNVAVGSEVTAEFDHEFLGGLEPFVHPYLPSDYRVDAHGLRIDSVVHIEAAWSGDRRFAKVDETTWVADLPFGRDSMSLGAIVGGGNPATLGFADLLDRHQAASALFRGIRTITAHHPDPGVPSFHPVEHALLAVDFLDGFHELADRRLCFEAMVYSHQLTDVIELADSFPETTIVLDHLGLPPGIFGPVGESTGASAEGRRDLLVRWTDHIAAVAARRNVVAKLTGLTSHVLGHFTVLNRRTPTTDELVLRIAPLVGHAIGVFGCDRLIWGSNFPVDRPDCDLHRGVRTVTAALGCCGAADEDLTKVFRTNAIRLYRIDSGRMDLPVRSTSPRSRDC